MKLTRDALKQIIKEELAEMAVDSQSAMAEVEGGTPPQSPYRMRMAVADELQSIELNVSSMLSGVAAVLEPSDPLRKMIERAVARVKQSVATLSSITAAK